MCVVLWPPGDSILVNVAPLKSHWASHSLLTISPVGHINYTINTSCDLFRCCITTTGTTYCEKGQTTLSNKSVFRFHHDPIPLSQHHLTTEQHDSDCAPHVSCCDNLLPLHFLLCILRKPKDLQCVCLESLCRVSSMRLYQRSLSYVITKFLLDGIDKINSCSFGKPIKLII